MKKIGLTFLFGLLGFGLFAQLKVHDTGTVTIGEEPDAWKGHNLTLSDTAATLGFGDGYNTKNVVIGEADGIDSDKLLLHGKSGIDFSTSNAFNTKMFLTDLGNLAIGSNLTTAKLAVDRGS